MTTYDVYHSLSRNRYRPLALVALASCSWANVTLAQEPAAAAVPGSAEAPVPSVPGEVKKAATPTPDSDTPGTTTQTPGEKPKNPFRTGESVRGNGAAKRSPFAYDTGDAAAPRTKASRKIGVQDAEEVTEKAAEQSANREEAETRLVAPSFYGRGPQVVTPGKGQYARPKFRFGVSVGLGFDDNPDQTATVNLSTVAKPRNRSGFTNVNGHWDAQWLKPTTAFTVNAELGGDFYWDRPGNSSDFNARLGMMYINKINQRTQLSANASFAFLSQPDYSNLYASSSQGGGDYFTGSTKVDLNHRWAPHFSTTTSASVNLLKYVNDSAAKLSNSYWAFVFGNEFRFQTSARTTWVIEGRYGLDEYISNSALNSQTAYFLGGLDWIASRHLSGNFRAGGSVRTYDSGGSSSAPYVEVAFNYLTGRHSTLTLNGRYGFEQSSVAGDQNLSYRFGLVYQQAFTARLSGNTGINFVHSDNSPRTGTRTSSDVYDFNVGLQYRLDRHFSLGTRYSYTLQDTSTGLQDFDRNRFLFTIQYEY